MEKKTCPKCKQTDHTDFSTCRNCGWTYSAVPPKMKSEHDNSFGTFLRGGGLIIVVLIISWTVKPLLRAFIHEGKSKAEYNATYEISKADDELEKNPQNVDALLQRAHGFYVIGEVEAASQDYNSAVAAQPQSAKVYRERAAFYESIGDTGLAKKDKQQAEKLGH